MFQARAISPASACSAALLAHPGTVTGEVPRLGLQPAIAPGPAEADRADRLVRGGAARPGDAADRHCQIGIGPQQRIAGQLAHGFMADGTEPLQRIGRHAKQGALGFVGVDHPAILEPGRAAGHGGDGRGHQTTGAGLGGRHPQTALLQQQTQLRGALDDRAVHLRHPSTVQVRPS